MKPSKPTPGKKTALLCLGAAACLGAGLFLGDSLHPRPKSLRYFVNYQAQRGGHPVVSWCTVQAGKPLSTAEDIRMMIGTILSNEQGISNVIPLNFYELK